MDDVEKERVVRGAWMVREVGLGWLILGLISVCALGWAARAGLDRLRNAHWIVAGPANESAFYQNYNPENVIKAFRFEGEGYRQGDGRGASPGILSVRHFAEFEPMFTIQVDRKGDLTQALREDVLSWFRVTGTKVVGCQDAPDGGFAYRYTIGNSIGSISVRPPVHDEGVHRQSQLWAGLDDILVKITLEETWTRPASETRWWMLHID